MHCEPVESGLFILDHRAELRQPSDDVVTDSDERLNQGFFNLDKPLVFTQIPLPVGIAENSQIG